MDSAPSIPFFSFIGQAFLPCAPIRHKAFLCPMPPSLQSCARNLILSPHSQPPSMVPSHPVFHPGPITITMLDNLGENQRRFLRGAAKMFERSQRLPVVHLKPGLSLHVFLNACKDAIERRELLKIQMTHYVNGTDDTRRLARKIAALMDDNNIENRTDVVDIRGKVALLYRRNMENPSVDWALMDKPQMEGAPPNMFNSRVGGLSRGRGRVRGRGGRGRGRGRGGRGRGPLIPKY